MRRYPLAGIAKPLLITVLLLALFSATAYAARVPIKADVIGNWLPMASAAVLVTYLISALAFMIGQGFRYDGVVEWAKNEFWEASLSAMMVGLIFFFVVFMTDVSETLVGQNHIDAGQAYIDEASGNLWGVFSSALGAIQTYAYLSNWWGRFFIPIPFFSSYVPPLVFAWLRLGTTLAPFGGYAEVLSGLSPLFTMIWTAVLTLAAEGAMLSFAKMSMLQVFLPLGLACRAFTLTRKMGGTMIALALTLYFVYPLSLALCKEVLDVYPIDYGFFKGSAAMSVGIGLITEIAGMFTGDNVSSIISLLKPGIQMFSTVMLLFVLTLIINITSFRAIAVLVGGDPQIFGLGKLGA